MIHYTQYQSLADVTLVFGGIIYACESQTSAAESPGGSGKAQVVGPPVEWSLRTESFNTFPGGADAPGPGLRSDSLMDNNFFTGK